MARAPQARACDLASHSVASLEYSSSARSRATSISALIIFNVELLGLKGGELVVVELFQRAEIDGLAIALQVNLCRARGGRRAGVRSRMTNARARAAPECRAWAEGGKCGLTSMSSSLPPPLSAPFFAAAPAAPRDSKIWRPVGRPERAPAAAAAASAAVAFFAFSSRRSAWKRSYHAANVSGVTGVPSRRLRSASSFAARSAAVRPSSSRSSSFAACRPPSPSPLHRSTIHSFAAA